MSAPSPSNRFERLPEWLRPRDTERPRKGRLRMIEATVLVLAGTFLAVATINDVGRAAHINERLSADLHTWRTYTHKDYKNVFVDELLLGEASTRQVVCGNTTPGGPEERTQLCLVVEGATHDGLRTVSGGWYLAPRTPNDVLSMRYGCFGRGARGFC